MTTDEKHVENLAGLSEVKSSTPKLSTAAGAAMSRRDMGVVSCLGSSELAHRQDYEGQCARDTQVVSHRPGSSHSHDEQVRSAD